MKTPSLFALLVLTATTASCDAIVGACGTVYDAEGNPVDGATVVVNTEKRWPVQCESDDSGYFDCQLNTSSPYKKTVNLRVSKEGHKPLQVAIRNNGISSLKIQLALLDSGLESTADIEFSEDLNNRPCRGTGNLKGRQEREIPTE